MKCEIDTENVNYLIGRIRLLVKSNGRLNKRVEGANEAIGVHREDIAELEHQLKHKDERIKELESTNHFDAAQTYQKELVKAEKRIKELEERVGRIDELTNEVYGEGPDYPARFTLNNVVYFEDETGCYMIADNTDEATILTVSITHQEYVDALNQYLKQEDPRDYPEEPSE